MYGPQPTRPWKSDLTGSRRWSGYVRRLPAPGNDHDKSEGFHGNAQCDVELRDVATGTIVDIGELNEQKDSVTLQPQGRPLVYLVNDACSVQVSPG